MSVQTIPGTRGSQVFVIGLALATALVVQTAVLSRIPLPYAQPDLVLVMVVAVALAVGPGGGMATGFAAGLASDLLADHPAGILALVFGVVGFGVGLLVEPERPTVARALAAVALATAAASLADAALLGILASPRLEWTTVLRVLPVSVLYNAVLAPFVVPTTWRVIRRTGLEPR